MLTLNMPSTVILWTVGVVAYVVSYCISAVKFKGDRSFHKWIYGICISIVLFFTVFTLYLDSIK